MQSTSQPRHSGHISPMGSFERLTALSSRLSKMRFLEKRPNGPAIYWRHDICAACALSEPCPPTDPVSDPRAQGVNRPLVLGTAATSTLLGLGLVLLVLRWLGGGPSYAHFRHRFRVAMTVLACSTFLKGAAAAAASRA